MEVQQNIPFPNQVIILLPKHFELEEICSKNM